MCHVCPSIFPHRDCLQGKQTKLIQSLRRWLLDLADADKQTNFQQSVPGFEVR